MAYADWLQLSKTQGSGNDSVNVSAASSNTGRNARTTTLTFKAANCADVARVVKQAGKPETTAIESSKAVGKTGGTVTLTGTSNSKKLTFSLGTGELPLTLPEKYTANGVQTNNGANISGDPGATSEYAFSIAFSVAENTAVAAKSRQVIVTDDGGNEHVCTLTIAGGDAFLTVAPESVELAWDGSDSKTFSVQSNTNWNIS